MTSNVSFTKSATGQTYGGQEVGALDYLGARCPDPNAPGRNPGFFTNSVGNGTWIRWGEDSGLGPSKPRMTFTVLGTPGSGAGSYGDPVRLRWQQLSYANETRDGVLGGGASNFAPDPLDLGIWYLGTFTISTQ